MRLLRLFAGFMLGLVSLVDASLAQETPRLSPPAMVADSFFRATGLERWHDAVKFLDLDAVARFRDEQVRTYRQRPARRLMTADEFLRFDPEMPRAVAEYQAKQANERSADPDVIAYQFARVPSIDSLAALSVAEVAARWLEAQGMRWQMHRAFELQRKQGCVIPDSLEAVMFAHPATVRIHGAVIEDSTAWVLHDEPRFADVEDVGVSRVRAARARPFAWAFPPRLTTMRLVRGTWRVLPGVPDGGMSFSANCPRVQKLSSPTR
jgi:hypothetical protein